MSRIEQSMLLVEKSIIRKGNDMISLSASGDFKKTTKFLDFVTKGNYINNILEECAQEGVRALQDATPKLSGLTASSWDYEIDKNMAVTINDPVIEEIRKTAKECAVAVSFGYIEKEGESLFSSQLTIGKSGDILDNFRRVSVGWKEPVADSHYKEGTGFHTFMFEDKECAVGLCGDFWDDTNVERMKALEADVVLWPVYTDFNYEEWNNTIKYEYAEQAARFGQGVCYVNSVCMDRDAYEIAKGGAAYFLDGRIKYQTPAGEESVLYIRL